MSRILQVYQDGAIRSVDTYSPSTTIQALGVVGFKDDEDQYTRIPLTIRGIAATVGAYKAAYRSKAYPRIAVKYNSMNTYYMCNGTPLQYK